MCAALSTLLFCTVRLELTLAVGAFNIRLHFKKIMYFGALVCWSGTEHACRLRHQMRDEILVNFPCRALSLLNAWRSEMLSILLSPCLVQAVPHVAVSLRQESQVNFAKDSYFSVRNYCLFCLSSIFVYCIRCLDLKLPLILISPSLSLSNYNSLNWPISSENVTYQTRFLCLYQFLVNNSSAVFSEVAHSQF